MKKIDLGQTVSVLANIGVIAGIIFLATEIRQNTTAVQASTAQSFTEGSQTYLMDLATDPELLNVLMKGRTDPSQLNEIEAVQVRLVIRRLWGRARGGYLQWQRGSLSDDDWQVFERDICIPGNLAELEVWSWNSERARQPDGFVEFVEECRPDLRSVESD